MKVALHHASSPSTRLVANAVKVAADVDCVVGGNCQVILLDADDTFDIIVVHPDGDRECIYSWIKEPEL